MEELENGEVVENQDVEVETENEETGAQVDETVSKKEFMRRVNHLTARAKTSEVKNIELKTKLAEYEKEKEAKAFSKLTAEQRQKAELEKRVAEFEKKEAEFNRKQLTLDISTDLQAKGLPKSFASVLALVDDSEKIIEILDEAVAEQADILKANLKQQLASKPTVKNVGNAGVDKAQFQKMSYAERTELYANNAELYKILSK